MNSLRNIPAVDELLGDGRVQGFIEMYSRSLVVGQIRELLGEFREHLRTGGESPSRLEMTETIIKHLGIRLEQITRGTLHRVINGTGVVLHTNLGRAVLSSSALRYINQVGEGYVDLEFDLATGVRGSRYSHVEGVLTNLTGAEAALVVNNNAAAVLLALNTLAAGREVIISRGELVEIGGAFRIPEVMRSSGSRLVEVGTTNRTYLRDFEQALTTETALLLAVHTSNYQIVGFTETVPLKALVELGASAGLPVMFDMGSGALFDFSPWGLRDEPTVQECIHQGVDVVTFSGDKLLGGPQAGIIVGKKDYIEEMKRNQLTRALRVDKFTIAALEATLLEYLTGDARQNIPALSMMTMDEGDLQQRAERFQARLQEELRDEVLIQSIETVKVEDQVGGGAYPTQGLPGYAVEICLKGDNAARVVGKLRTGEPSVLTRIQDDRLLISLRTLLPGDEELIAGRLQQVIGGIRVE